jgi:hypothetical protein
VRFDPARPTARHDRDDLVVLLRAGAVTGYRLGSEKAEREDSPPSAPSPWRGAWRPHPLSRAPPVRTPRPQLSKSKPTDTLRRGGVSCRI